MAGDGNLVTTKASATGVQVAVDTAKVKDLAVDAVTVSKANTADNLITVTPTAGTNSKDYAIGIDTTKLASKTDLTYRANSDTDANAQKVSLAKGLNFVMVIIRLPLLLQMVKCPMTLMRLLKLKLMNLPLLLQEISLLAQIAVQHLANP